ncbi:MAG: hypothetical protein IJB67_05275 [Firmicutes bacterium]|nr:hypothetical protein [Bacillota bacterium]
MQETENRSESIISRVARLIDVKSIVTLALVGVMCIMTVTEKETGELFNSCIMLVLGFFFGKNLNGGQNKEG